MHKDVNTVLLSVQCICIVFMALTTVEEIRQLKIPESGESVNAGYTNERHPAIQEPVSLHGMEGRKILL